jgi:putative ABC transport system permease protein
MSLIINFQQGMRSLALHRMRTFLSTLGILFGVVSVIAMLSIGEGAKHETLAQIEHLGMNSITIRQNTIAEEQQQKMREHRSYGLTRKDGESLQKSVPYVDVLAMLKVVEAPIQAIFTGISPEILAVTQPFEKIKGLELSEGRFICDLDIHKKSRVCALGSEVAKSLGKHGHSGQVLRIDNVEFQIIGVLKTKKWKAGKTNALTSRNLNKSLFIPLGVEMTLPQAKQTLKGEALSEITLQITHSDKLPLSVGVIKRIMQALHGNVEDYQIVVPQELLEQAYRTQYTFNLVLGSIAAISLLVGGIGIMNIMLATVSERTREIGIRRAVGANKRHIAYQFLTETMLLTLIGATLGVILGVGFSMLISYLAGWTTVVTWWSVILSLGMASLVGVISGLYPAIKAANMNPITALRHD